MPELDQDCAPEQIAALELIPGHPTTAAEVRVWRGRVPGIDGDAGPWVVMSADDWPMAPDAARALAAALVRAADRIDPPAPEAPATRRRYRPLRSGGRALLARTLAVAPAKMRQSLRAAARERAAAERRCHGQQPLHDPDGPPGHAVGAVECEVPLAERLGG